MDTFRGVGFLPKKANMQEGPTAFQRTNKNRRGGRLLWGHPQGTLGPENKQSVRHSRCGEGPTLPEPLILLHGFIVAREGITRDHRKYAIEMQKLPAVEIILACVRFVRIFCFRADERHVPRGAVELTRSSILPMQGNMAMVNSNFSAFEIT